MKHYLILITLTFYINLSFSQKISNIDYDLIQKEIKDSSSLYFYPKMVELFNKNIELTPEEYTFLYYGNVYYKGYSTRQKTEYDSKFNELLNKKEYEKAIPFGKKSLEKNPVNLGTLFRMLVCYHYLGITDTAKIYGNKYYNFINVILASGDGKSVKTAYVVNGVSDEYQILYELGLKAKGQALLSEGPTDLLYIETKGQKKVKGQKKIKEVYFNIAKYWEATARMFSKETKENESEKSDK